jgi:hypothetical protein
MLSIQVFRFSCRNLSSSSSSKIRNGNSNSSNLFRLPYRKASLGLDFLVRKLGVLETITQLPEVATAISEIDHSPSKSREKLQRADQVFAHMRSEHIAVLALLAEAQRSLNDLQPCLQTLARIQEYFAEDIDQNSRNKEAFFYSDLVDIAKAKIHWMRGEFDQTLHICDMILDRGNFSELVSNEVMLAAQTGHALARLVTMDTLDDAFTVKDPFRMVVKALEGYPCAALAAAYLNMGVVEIGWKDICEKFNDVDAPWDAAMRNWKTGLTTLKRSDREVRNSVRNLLEAHLNTNLAWGLLQMTHEYDHVKRASEYAAAALAVYDKKFSGEDEHAKEGLPRTLAILASCYHQMDNAVTAEGLFRSAIALPTNTNTTSNHNQNQSYPPLLIERRDVLLRYSKLLRDWEKRETDADRYSVLADEFESALPEKWRNKSSILSSVWFWTPSMFQY